jgi:hypothetical protein
MFSEGGIIAPFVVFAIVASVVVRIMFAYYAILFHRLRHSRFR